MTTARAKPYQQSSAQVQARGGEEGAVSVGAAQLDIQLRQCSQALCLHL